MTIVSAAVYRGKAPSHGFPAPVMAYSPQEHALDPRHDLFNHSPDGFAWGYSGSGPAQLALAILADLYDDEFAVRHHQAFKRDCIATRPQREAFELDENEISAWVRRVAEPADRKAGLWPAMKVEASVPCFRQVEVEIPEYCPECGADLRERLRCWQWSATKCCTTMDGADLFEVESLGTSDWENTAECDFHCGECGHAFGPGDLEKY